MVLIQVRLNEAQDKKVAIHRIKCNFKTKAEAIADIIQKHGGK